MANSMAIKEMPVTARRVHPSTQAGYAASSRATGGTGAPARHCLLVSRKLARGKPLPPGIAKKLDGRLLGHLPRYDGYEWQQAGTDLILVTIATGVIYEVLHGILD